MKDNRIGRSGLGRFIPGTSDESYTREEENGSENTINKDLSYAFVTAAAINKRNSGHDEANNAHNR